MFLGIDLGTSKAGLAYAVLEGVAFGLADGLAARRGVNAAPQHAATSTGTTNR